MSDYEVSELTKMLTDRAAVSDEDEVLLLNAATSIEHLAHRLTRYEEVVKAANDVRPFLEALDHEILDRLLAALDKEKE
jgi:hypothetical protein